MLRRAIAIIVLTGASLFVASRFHGPGSTPVVAAAESDPPATTLTTLPVPSPPPASTSATTTAPPPIAIAVPEITDGADTFLGSRIYTNWGWTLVEISVIDGVIVDVEMVMIPRATKRSEALTAEWEPILRNQVLTTQSPDVDAITGATVLSNGYRASLIGAMKAAGLWPPEQA